ncbi:Phosphatidylinositol 4,5-bisphosphate-binding protein SLM1, partial [Zancudomyces culisetae]
FNGFSLPSNKCNKQSLGNSTASCSAPTNPATLRLEHKNFSTISVKLPWLFKKTFGSSKTELLEKSKAELKYPKGTNKYTLSSRNGSSVESYEKGGYHSVSSMDLAKELSLSGKMLDISAETNNIDRSTYFEQNEKDSYEDQLDRSCSQRTTCNDPLELYSKGSQTYPDKENICEAIDLEADYHANEKSIPTMNSYYFKSNLSLSSVFRPMRSGFFTRGGQIEAFTAGSGSELDLVVQRLLSWYYILTGVSNYFGELAKHTTDSLKHITLIEQRVKLEGLTQMPFSDTKDLGVKRILRDIKVASEVNSLRKNRFTNVLVDELCPKLRSLSKVSKDSAKSYIVYMKSTYPPVKKYFKQTASSLKKLETAINEFHLDKKQAVDPWLVYIAYIKQLKQKYGAQNHVNKVFQLKLAEIRETDMKIFTEFKKVMQDFLDVYSKLYIAYDFNVLKMIEYIRAVPDSLEWDAFEKRYQAELNAPNGFCGTQSLETMNYPYKASMYSKIVREGCIEREKGVIKAFSSCYAVITGTGFLHCFSSESAVPDAAPEISIFLPNSAIKHASGKRFTITVSKGFTKERHHFRCLHSRLSLDWIYELKVASAPS